MKKNNSPKFRSSFGQYKKIRMFWRYDFYLRKIDTPGYAHTYFCKSVYTVERNWVFWDFYFPFDLRRWWIRPNDAPCCEFSLVMIISCLFFINSCAKFLCSLSISDLLSALVGVPIQLVLFSSGAKTFLIPNTFTPCFSKALLPLFFTHSL